MSHLFCFLSLLWSSLLVAQNRWDGEARDGQWSNPLNWVANHIPAPGEAVLLDNSFVDSSYTVSLPGGDTTVSVGQIVITPAALRQIELSLPATNQAVPGLLVNGGGYALDIGVGGVFRNASGAASGIPVNIADSIRIHNGGRFVHNSARSHAANVQILSAAPGTELGVMQFQVPLSSSTVSLSNRRYGTLMLSKPAGATACKYTVAGTGGAHIRGNLIVGSGVSWGLNFSDTIAVSGDFIDSGTVDLGNTSRRVVLALSGNLVQPPGGSIMESGSASPEIRFCGQTPQSVSMNGTLADSVSVKLDADADLQLQSPFTIPYSLTLVKGRIRSTATAPLIVADSATVVADTVAASSFVDGPIQKRGLSNAGFVFPVGSGHSMRWIGVGRASGDITVQHVQGNPMNVGGVAGSGIDHLSSVEYWKVRCSNNLSTTIARLSFNDPASGGVTDLMSLRVSMLVGSNWNDAGNAARAGSAGANGWVDSNPLALSSGVHFFTLASSQPENPLPITTITLQQTSIGDRLQLFWSDVSDEILQSFELEGRREGGNVTSIGRFAAGRDHRHVANMEWPDSNIEYRIAAVDAHGRQSYSNWIVVRGRPRQLLKMQAIGTATHLYAINVYGVRGEQLMMRIFAIDGRLVRQQRFAQVADGSRLQLDVSRLVSGWYLCSLTTESGRVATAPFVKVAL